MPSKFTKAIKRQHVIEGYEVNLAFDEDGITVTKKGDKHRIKPTIKLSWSDVMELGAERMKEKGELMRDNTECESAYDFLGLD